MRMVEPGKGDGERKKIDDARGRGKDLRHDLGQAARVMVRTRMRDRRGQARKNRANIPHRKE